MRADGVEQKFNPYHDPRNGQFTFAPGGPRSLSRVLVSQGGQQRIVRFDTPETAESATLSSDTMPRLADAVVRSEDAQSARMEPARFPRVPRTGGRSNSRAFDDPLTLEQVFPGLRDAPGGAIVALGDTLFDLTGPSRALTAELTRNLSNTLIAQIKEVDPSYRFDSLGFPQTLQGQINQINGLRFERAAALMRTRGELRPLQVETLRFVQEATDRAYERGLRRLLADELPVRLSPREALGNYIDREVRRELRQRYAQLGIEAAGAGPVRVNRRENDTSGAETSFRLPDARVGAIAYDMTLAQKTLASTQIRGFFQTDFAPTQVIIVRPRQLGIDSSYIITRPEAKR